MVRRRSTVRFRKGAPQPAGQVQVSDLPDRLSRSSDRQLTVVLDVVSWHSASRTDRRWHIGRRGVRVGLNRRGSAAAADIDPRLGAGQGRCGQKLRFRSVRDGGHHRADESGGDHRRGLLGPATRTTSQPWRSVAFAHAQLRARRFRVNAVQFPADSARLNGDPPEWRAARRLPAYEYPEATGVCRLVVSVRKEASGSAIRRHPRVWGRVRSRVSRGRG